MSGPSSKYKNSIVLLPRPVPLIPEDGEIYYDESENKFKKYENGQWSDFGDGGSGGINYIENGDAENDTAGYVTYADAAGSIPVDGTGGSANVTWTRSTVDPLRGLASFLFTKDAANRQGQGTSYDFPIDRADRGTVQQISWDHELVSGTYDSGTSTTNSDLIVYIYDVTNSKLIEPSGMKVQVGMKGLATFQTSIDSVSYRLIIHQSLTGTSAYVMKFDNIRVGPQVTASGSTISNGTSYTPTFTNSPTRTADRFVWYRRGPKMRIEGSFTATGAGGAGNFTVSPPSGYSPVNVAGITGHAYYVDTGVNVRTAAASYDNVNNNINFSIDSATTLLQGNTFSNTDFFGFAIELDIQGWAANSVVSSETDTRIVDMQATRASAGVTANTTIANWTTVPKDSHGAFNITTGVYTVKVPGDYFVTFNPDVGSGASTPQIRKNGSIVINGVTAQAGVTIGTASGLVPNCVVGDTITVTISTSVNMSGNWHLFRLSGPAQISASETVAASYWVSADKAASTTVPVDFDSKEFDTHNAVTTGSGWKFRAPLNGLYTIIGTGAITTGGTFAVLYKNGVLYKMCGAISISSGTAGIWTTTISLKEGEYIDLRPSGSVTVNGGTLSNLDTCTISIFRAGNYA